MVAPPSQKCRPPATWEVGRWTLAQVFRPFSRFMWPTTASSSAQMIAWQEHRILGIDKVSTDSHITLQACSTVSIATTMNLVEHTDVKDIAEASRGMHFIEIATVAFHQNDHLQSLSPAATTSATDIAVCEPLGASVTL